MRKITFYFLLINFLLAIEFQTDKNKFILNSSFFFTYDYAQKKMGNILFTTNSFYFPRVILDVKNQYQDMFFLRFYLDMAGMGNISVYELYGGIKPKKELEIIFGKFKQLLGYELIIYPLASYFVEPSMFYYLKAPFIWDMGIGFFYRFKKGEANINLVNGSGGAVFDNNEWKDISGRFSFNLFKNLFWGTSFYYGKVGYGKIKDLLPFFSGGWEFGYKDSFNIIIFEYFYRREKDIAFYNYKKQGFYFILGWQLAELSPFLRFEFKEEKKEERELSKEFGFSFSLNYFLKNERFKIMPNFCYYYYGKNHHLIKFIFQFQANI
jgi:hypothetical protein